MDRNSPLFNWSHNYHDNGLGGYDRYFNDDPATGRLRLEATPDYLYQKTPLEVFDQISIRPKVIFILRKPSERAYSAYRFFSGHKSVFDRSLTFSQYMECVKDKSGPTHNRLWPLIENTVRYGEYETYLKAWGDLLGQNRIVLCLFEELQRNPKRLMKQLAQALSIDSQFYENYAFTVHNRSYGVKNIPLHRLKQKVAARLPNSTVKRIFGRIYKALNITTNLAERTDEDSALLNVLDVHYRPFNARLSARFGVDLHLWE